MLSSRGLDFQVDFKAMPSRVVRPYYNGIYRVPEDIPEGSSTFIVFALLNMCFALAREVREAPIREALFGFAQGGYPIPLLIDGFRDLITKEYLAYGNSEGQPVYVSGLNPDLWFLVQPRFAHLLVGPHEAGLCPKVSFNTVRLDNLLIKDPDAI